MAVARAVHREAYGTVKGGAGAEEGRSGVAEGELTCCGSRWVDSGLVSSRTYMAQVLCRMREVRFPETCVVKGPSGIRKVPEEVLEKQLGEFTGKSTGGESREGVMTSEKS